jgi:hypothetical protein
MRPADVYTATRIDNEIVSQAELSAQRGESWIANRRSGSGGNDKYAIDEKTDMRNRRSTFRMGCGTTKRVSALWMARASKAQGSPKGEQQQAVVYKSHIPCSKLRYYVIVKIVKIGGWHIMPKELESSTQQPSHATLI